MSVAVKTSAITSAQKTLKALPAKTIVQGFVNIIEKLEWAKQMFLTVESSSVGSVAKRLNRSSTYIGRICRAYQYSLIPGVAKALNAGKLTWSKLMKIAESTKSRSAILALI